MNKTEELKERTLIFAGNVIILCQTIELNAISSPLINQLIRSATSVGANYREAQSAISRKDFRNKIYISKKEIDETLYWLELMHGAFSDKQNEIQELINECKQLANIFHAITLKLDGLR